jgi:hypothetical protein
MGYTHYWNQARDFTRAEWADVRADLAAILKHAQHEHGIALGNGAGDGGSSPEVSDDKVWFNGIGDDAHETMCINRVRPAKESWQSKRGNDFCKTARKPYDVAVVAVLCYLSTITRRDDPATGEPIVGSEAFTVSSDGDGAEFLDGLELARRALPSKANMLDIPMDVMRADRWCMPWVNVKDRTKYQVHFCVDGRGYVLRGKESYCFETHKALAQFLERTKRATYSKRHVVRWNDRVLEDCGREEPNIWNAYGSFDPERHARIGRAQSRVLATLFPVDPSCARQPPLYESSPSK